MLNNNRKTITEKIITQMWQDINNWILRSIFYYSFNFSVVFFKMKIKK